VKYFPRSSANVKKKSPRAAWRVSFEKKIKGELTGPRPGDPNIKFKEKLPKKHEKKERTGIEGNAIFALHPQKKKGQDNENSRRKKTKN